MTFRVMGLCYGIDRENILDAELQAFVAGPIANRLSEDRALLLGMALYSICFIGFALASSVWAFPPIFHSCRAQIFDAATGPPREVQARRARVRKALGG